LNWDKLKELEGRYEALTDQLADPEVLADPARLIEVSRKRGELEEVVEIYRRHRGDTAELVDARALLEQTEDPEMLALAQEEIADLEGRLGGLEQQLKVLLLPQDPNDARNVVLEIRAGTGGNEASLFARDLFRMYSRYAEALGWKVDVTDVHETAVGGVKEVVAVIEGRGAYSRLKYESGVHRVQRVPETEASGRIHTSAATVAVLPEAEDVDIEIKEKDLRVDRFCSSGPGGQSVNTTYSAIRLTHLPTGIVVSCQDEKSQIKNKAKALRVLKSRLYDLEMSKRQEEEAAARRSMVRSGDRSEKIRTYNFPQNRVTDHRIGFTTHDLQGFLDGALEAMVDALATREQAELLGEAVS